MKRYCHKCGHEVADDDKFCHNCGTRIEAAPTAAPPQETKQHPPAARQPAGTPPVSSAESPVRYVQVDTRTGKITPNTGQAKSGSESMMQGLTIAFVAIAVVIVMVAGSMFISGHMKKNITAGEDAETESAVPVVSEVSSEVSSEEEPVSSQEEEVSSIPPEWQADYLRSKMKGTWSTKLPYKSMSLPVTFTFDDAGHCSCVIKALFITKQFDGSYTVRDGGSCTVTLNGLEEYMSEGNTLTGNIEFISDDVVNFTVGNEIWVLNRTE